jgi:hypothetical protein
LELRNVRVRGLTFLGPRTHKKKRERPADSADSTREEKACSPGISSAISQKEEPCISTPQDTETLDLRERDNGVESEKRTPFYFFRSQKLCMKSHGEKKTKHKGVQKPKLFVKKKKKKTTNENKWRSYYRFKTVCRLRHLPSPTW